MTDAAGNAAEPAIRTVKVVDTIKPNLILLGESLVYIECPGNYVDAGAAAVDETADGDMAASIVSLATVLIRPGREPISSGTT